ncbi:MAG: site-specific DNA-methyltransferase, partial [Chloroflexi bacterium]|nr:site-specific DNA-methyltransferase [Chloroflexota bacterium]
MTDLAEFIARYAKPYDPETDTYRRPPFAAPVKAGKNTAIYNAHSYHTKVPPQGIVPYIEHYTEPGDLVLDPFCGSGMTGVACLMTGRHAILNDLSPAAVHIATNYCTPVDVDALKREFERIKSAVKEEFDWLYGTTCDRCGGPATIQYTIWSDVFACSRCGGEIVLWDVAVDRATGKVSERFTCPTCGLEQTKRQVRWLRSVPVVTNYECPRCKPRRAEHPTTAAEKARIAEIEATPIPYWYPTTPFDESWEMWRGAHGTAGITCVSHFFTSRNLRAFSSLWDKAGEASESTVAERVRFALTAIMGVGSRRNRWPQQQTISGTLYVPSLSIEMNVVEQVRRRGALVLQAAELMRQSCRSCATIVVRGPATELPLPDSQLDYAFTDPPFGSNIFYADCNLIWEAWLNQGFTDQSQDAVVHVKHKDKNTLPDYARLMTDSFREMHRMLKPGRWASVVFHNSDDRIWQTILDAAETAGFELAE